MPLRCLDPESGSSLLAFDLSDSAWNALKADNKQRRHLRLPCCGAGVVLRRSRLGMPHFVHKAVAACTAEPETEAHLRLKQLVVEAARAHGWEAQTEATGQTPGGEPWRADVLACKGQAWVAVEVQWSRQSDRETMRRQDRYRLSGVRGLWLFQQALFPISGEFAAARVLGTSRDGFTAVLACAGSEQKLPMTEFLDAAFGERLRFSLPLGIEGRVTIHVARLTCWSCGAETEILSSVNVRAGPHMAHLTTAELDKDSELWDAVRRLVPSAHPLSAVWTQAWTRPSCSRCGWSFREFDVQNTWYGRKVLCEASIQLDEPWREVLSRCGTPAAGWAVF